MLQYLTPMPAPSQKTKELEEMVFADMTTLDDSDDDHDSRTVSPEPSLAPSVFGLTKSMAEKMVVYKYGRKVNTTCPTYSVATDEWELERQHLVHEIIKSTIGLFIGPVHELLTRQDGMYKRVLDLGTGCGSWTLDMAKQYPSVEFTGVDVVPPNIDSDAVPENCRFELDDINLPLVHFYNDFDFVHIRFIASGIKNYGYLIEQVANILRPGGLVQVGEADGKAYRSPSREGYIDPRYPPGHPEYSAYGAWLQLAVQCIQKKGGDSSAAMMSRIWIREHRAFEEVEYSELWLPTGAYFPGNTPEEIHWNRIGPVTTENLIGFMYAARPLLLDYLSPEVVGEAEEQAVHELRYSTRPLWVRMTVVCARRR
ncbi:hypothetical protein FRC03_008448 [Tulasnella sp. 419]|nr:hypothetical protein FRC03_008448 [Tulasnella sp. 419]